MATTPISSEMSSTSAGSSIVSIASSSEQTVPWIVRHTFVDVPMERSPSIKAFYRPREVKSAPASIIGDIPAVPDMLPTPPAQQETSVQSAPVILRLADVLDSELPCSSLPTLESHAHFGGKCEPCAFCWKFGGWQNGVICSFCHAQAAGQKKHHKKGRGIWM